MNAGAHGTPRRSDQQLALLMGNFVLIPLLVWGLVLLLPDDPALLLSVLPVFVASALAAALIARVLTRFLSLPVSSGRTLAFSLGTRNSFVVLPFALALPAGWETTVIVIVLQSLVELFAMALYLWWIPRNLFRA